MPWLIPNIDPQHGGTMIDTTGTGDRRPNRTAWPDGDYWGADYVEYGLPPRRFAPALTAPNPVVGPPATSTF